ncbi:hypothetical protein M409DRAFT_54063 [Zasmidium cellare ATCC 36951]|uniref:Uncharacterized protein n=1 Tax=Zasmidium cellare ATCC 36951 TaxID=1080233 RepID=A0A6A6CJY3_ZASCE|nr:uncharacterized protein M409DRAFT_54063 [Zasmidium cellare ATCC 36951]KAF2167465.1 hypothetical protein M409DRAFT_54063 [Zasmidium cellare ATCC 36951]
MSSSRTMRPAEKRARQSATPTNSPSADSISSLARPMNRSLNSSAMPPCSGPTTDLAKLTLRFQRLSLNPPRVVTPVLGKRKRDDEDYEEEEHVLAAARVLGIPELVEQVMLNLSPAEILLTQAFAPTFRTVYQDSKQLQLKTLDRLDIPPKISVPAASTPAKLNPLLVERHYHDDNFRVDDYELKRPQGVLRFLMTVREGIMPLARLIFDEESKGLEVTDKSSLLKQHIYDSATTLKLSVFCGADEIQREDGGMWEVDLHAEVNVKNCQVGKLVQVAKKLRSGSDFSFVHSKRNGQSPWGPSHTAKFRLTNIDPELLDVIVGQVTLHDRLVRQIRGG